MKGPSEEKDDSLIKKASTSTQLFTLPRGLHASGYSSSLNIGYHHYLHSFISVIPLHLFVNTHPLPKNIPESAESHSASNSQKTDVMCTRRLGLCNEREPVQHHASLSRSVPTAQCRPESSVLCAYHIRREEVAEWASS